MVTRLPFFSFHPLGIWEFVHLPFGDLRVNYFLEFRGARRWRPRCWVVQEQGDKGSGLV